MGFLKNKFLSALENFQNRSFYKKNLVFQFVFKFFQLIQIHGNQIKKLYNPIFTYHH